MDSLVSTKTLAGMLGAPDLCVVDASAFPLDPSRDPRGDYTAGHIPGAVFLDLPSLNDPDRALPGMLPSADRFARRMEALGIGDRDRIVLYDDTPHRTAARAWWMFRMFGVADVAILDGGLGKWRTEGRAMATGVERRSGSPIALGAPVAAVRDLAQMRANLANGAEQVLDARSAARFTGEEPDPRGLAPGHIPGSRHLSYARVLNPDSTLRSLAELRAAFEDAGIDLARPLVTTCGSGVTAAVLAFAAHLLGKRDVALYDGSWSEWGALPDTPKQTGPARAV